MSDKENQLALARALLNRHGLHNWEVGFADLSRVKSRNLTGVSYGVNGVCQFLSRTILIDPKLIGRRNKFLNTLRHEVAHALLNRPGHGRNWLRIAKRVGCTTKHLAVYEGGLHG